MAGFNQVVLMGKLVRDPDLKYVSGMPLCTLRLVVPRFYKGKDGQRKNDSLFIDVLVWRHMAEVCAQALRKQSEVMVSGRLQMNDWTGRDGHRRQAYRVQSERIQFLRRGPSEAQAGAENETPEEKPNSDAA